MSKTELVMLGLRCYWAEHGIAPTGAELFAYMNNGTLDLSDVRAILSAGQWRTGNGTVAEGKRACSVRGNRATTWRPYDHAARPTWPKTWRRDDAA